jgi:hypothetical protein
MNIKKLDVAIFEAMRFLQKANELRNHGAPSGYFYGSKESGSVKRSSMDLTRALADLRRSGD